MACSPGNTQGTVKTVLDKENRTKPEDLALQRQNRDNHELPWHLRPQSWSRLVHLAQPKPSQGKRDDAVDSEEAPKEKATTQEALKEETSAAPRDEADSAPETQETHAPLQNGTIPASALRFPLAYHDETPAMEGWTPTYTRTSTVFGHLLHPFPSNGQHAPLDHQKTIDSSSVILRPVLPPVSPLMNLAAGATDSPSASLLIHLRPKGGQAPALEFHLAVPDEILAPLDWESTPKRLVAVRSSWAAHTRLPLHPVDATVRQSLVTEMQPDTISSSAALHHFFESSMLDFEKDLLCPTSLTIPLPVRLLGGEGEGEAEVDFHFMGLELRTTAAVPFRSGRLSLTSVEAGQQGRRAELAFEPPVVPASVARDRARGYLDEVLGVAKGSYFPWVGARPADAASVESS
ncbi:hypothetical protein IMZ48_06365 [Candidatus Bathyarchaeota archaeon]|nr:hypothetical protein [Candidatus Bathyarchaeota archaeon]